MGPDHAARLPDRSTFLQRYGATPARARAARRLFALLQKSPDHAAASDAILGWLRSLVRLSLLRAADLRLGLLNDVLREHPAIAGELGEMVRRVLADGKASRLFSSTGLPTRAGLMAEAGKRLMGHLLPEAPIHGDLARTITFLFPGEKWVEAAESCSPASLAELHHLLGRPFEVLADGVPEALLIVSTRIAALGLADDLASRTALDDVASLPWIELLERSRELVAQPDQERLAHCMAAIGDCKETVAGVRSTLEQGGVSIDLVYRLELIGESLTRVELLSRALVARASPAAGSEQHGRSLFLTLIRGANRERSVRALFRKNVEMLSRKVVEHSSETGDHYITSSSREYWQMLASAGGGGVLTAGTTVAKFWVAAAKLPLLIEGLASALNYAGSFVAMQFAGFTLATKQPSVTAAALARAIEKQEVEGDHSAFSDVVARITRSQFAAAVGNLGLVVPAALLVELLSRSLGRGPLLDAETADYVVASLHPLDSWTIPFAALTGVLLWASSVFAGTAQNWSNYHRLPEAIASVRWVRSLFGARGSAWLQRFIERSVAGIGGNVSLGVLLGATPVLGKLVGLAVDVRHVTLSTGSLAFAAAALGWQSVLTPAFGAALIGIAIIALLNFGVSFALALWVARRSEGLAGGTRLRFLRALWTKLRHAPLDFVRPPPEAALLPAPASEPEPG